jgi:hypothetical protein
LRGVLWEHQQVRDGVKNRSKIRLTETRFLIRYIEAIELAQYVYVRTCVNM